MLTKYTKTFSYVEGRIQHDEEVFIQHVETFEHTSTLPFYYLKALLDKYKYAPFY